MKGKIFFISGPSGVGKGTLINALRERHKNWEFPPSCTTRDPRPGEIDGKTYFFVSREEFEKKIDEDEFLEYATVHQGNLYGTLWKPLVEGAKKGKIVVREFDVQGFRQMREKLPRDLYTSIFLKPDGGIDTLVERIRDRAPITETELARRIESMQKEFAMEKMYDHTVISTDGEIEQMVEDAEKIIEETVKE
ncbi:guanylate kinase [Candidatus Gracilibacteria bacterium]|nr:guanylate kinase [Candidatus Gracilibacteria bacterium]